VNRKSIRVKKYICSTLFAVCTLGGVFAGCAPTSPIGLVDIGRISANWPEYQNYQNQLYLDQQTLTNSKVSNAVKQREANALQLKYGKITMQLTQQIKDAATKIAQQKQLKLVLTREGVGYGGVDITADVEKAMGITEKASPTP